MGLRHSRCKTYNCCICLSSRGKYITLKCGHIFHQKCLNQLQIYKQGDFIFERKHSCPSCRVKFPLNIDNVYHQKIMNVDGYLKDIYCDYSKQKTDTKYHRFCAKCDKVFEAGNKSCQIDMDDLPNYCMSCDNKITMQLDRNKYCPTCNCFIHWTSGCAKMYCIKCKTSFCFIHEKTSKDIRLLTSKIFANPNKYTYGNKINSIPALLQDDYVIYCCPECVINDLNFRSFDGMSLSEINALQTKFIIKK
jgi:hypothetical protein